MGPCAHSLFRNYQKGEATEFMLGLCRSPTLGWSGGEPLSDGRRVHLSGLPSEAREAVSPDLVRDLVRQGAVLQSLVSHILPCAFLASLGGHVQCPLGLAVEQTV